MARFQALTNPLLDEELERLRIRLGLGRSQKAELLRELAALGAWVLGQAEAGRTIEARAGDQVETLAHPAVERLRMGSMAVAERVALYGAEAAKLAEVLERPFRPGPGLRRSLANLANPDRKPPRIRWKSARNRPSRRRTR